MQEFPCQNRNCPYCIAYDTALVSKEYAISGKLSKNKLSPCPICSEFIGFSLYTEAPVLIIDFSAREILIPTPEGYQKESEMQQEKEESVKILTPKRKTRKKIKKTRKQALPKEVIKEDVVETPIVPVDIDRAGTG